jgi:hypothetical protein
LVHHIGPFANPFPIHCPSAGSFCDYVRTR